MSLIPGVSVKAAKVLLLRWIISASMISFCCCDPVDQEPSVLGAKQMQKNVSIHPLRNYLRISKCFPRRPEHYRALPLFICS